MSFAELYIPLDTAREVVLALGEQGMVHFVDKNSDVSAFQRAFVKEIRRLDNTERQLRYLRNVIEHSHQIGLAHDAHLTLQPTSVTQIEQLSHDIDVLEQRVSQLESSYLSLVKRHASLIEHRQVLKGSRQFFQSGIQSQARISIDQVDNAPLLLEQESLEAGIQLSDLQDLTLNYVIGSIPTAKVDILNRILWRSLRGNLYMNSRPLEEPNEEKHSEEQVEKSVFIVFTHGQLLLSRVKKIAESLEGHVYNDIGSDPELYDQVVKDLNMKITDLTQVMFSTHQQLEAELFVIADQLEVWQAIVKREKMIYSTMNLFSDGSRGLVAEGWIPTSEIASVKNVLRDIEGSGSAVLSLLHTRKSPPTYHKTNKFTDAFQSIVDAYGVASYQEVNPGLATVVTFPFMFAIMFGDLGHGFIVFLIALLLVLKEKTLQYQKKDEIFDMAFSGRYILLLMGLFSMYTGLMYNDIFSRSMTLFHSGWEWPKVETAGETVVAERVGVYPFGLDWAWHGAENNLIFTNSYKMKLSILMGYMHMSYSFLFSLVNYRFRHSRVDIIGNFIPGLIFMQSIFGYLSFTIVFKWAHNWIEMGKPAPGLLNMLINMFLAPGTIDDELYPFQGFVQSILVLLALACVPMLLLYKPMTLRRKNNLAIQAGYTNIHEQEHTETVQDREEAAGDDFVITHSGSEDHEEFNFGDIMIHQVIHTIEFCLNCVSHTASYLRLWALSLAHAQLSSVLWSMTIANAFTSVDPKAPVQVIKCVVLFAMWFCLTVAILVMMEGTSAMLHSLRLHWVEAMSKFFEGEGYAYEPFNFQHINEEETL